MVKIIVVGGTGTIGKAVAKALSQRHTVIIAGHKSGDIQVNIEDNQSIEDLYQSVGKFDALVATTGNVKFFEFSKLTEKDFYIGLQSKLMGQVNLVRIGQQYINDHGSFTLTSGLLSQDPIRYGSSASMVNAAIEGFVKGCAIEILRGIRINVVSPTVITESLPQYGPYFLGYEPISAERAAMGYIKSIEGLQTGQVYKMGW